VASTVQTSAKGAINGVAALDSGAKMQVANVPAGSMLRYIYNGVSWPASRPSSDTSITYYIIAPAGTPQPSWALSGIDWFSTF